MIAVKVIDLAAARRALAALRISIARGSSFISGPASVGFFSGLTGFAALGALCAGGVCWPALPTANRIPAADSSVLPMKCVRLISARERAWTSDHWRKTHGIIPHSTILLAMGGATMLLNAVRPC